MIDKNKNKQINIRINNQTLELIDNKAKNANMNRSEFIINAILISKIKAKNKDIFKLISAINRIGNNINQISRTLNIANNDNNLSDILFENILDKLSIINYQLDIIIKEVKK